jgi:hypothetical protein
VSDPTLDPVPDATNDPVAQRQSDRAADLEAADTRTDGGSVPFDVRESTPNSSGPQGAAGGMGVSSEREGPDAASAAGHGITGTGTTGDARTRTDGVVDSSPQAWDAPDIALGDGGAGSGGDVGARTAGALSGRPETTGRSDRDDELAYVEGTEQRTGPAVDSGADQGPVRTEGNEGVDRTVGEPNTMPLGGDKPHDTGRDGPL